MFWGSGVALLTLMGKYVRGYNVLMFIFVSSFIAQIRFTIALAALCSSLITPSLAFCSFMVAPSVDVSLTL